ncbi:MAG: hypothetical protein WCL39_13675, partial [Armatimonadota bacterium]
MRVLPLTVLAVSVGCGLADAALLLQVNSTVVSGGNGDSSVDPDECITLTVNIKNAGDVIATGVSAVATTITPNITLTEGVSAYPDIDVGATQANVTPYLLSASSVFGCAAAVSVTLTVTANGQTFPFTIPLSSGSQTQFAVVGPSGTITDGITSGTTAPHTPSTTTFPVSVSGIQGALQTAQVSLYITHPDVRDLKIVLVPPAGSALPSLTLMENRLDASGSIRGGMGGLGTALGSACSPSTSRTTFVDTATATIPSGVVPYAGNYKPSSAFSAYLNAPASNVNGVWSLQITDFRGSGTTGRVECWTLSMTALPVCAAGGGTCPYADLEITQTATPEIVAAGNDVTYTIAVKNLGRDTAFNVEVTDILPASLTFVSCSTGGGTCAGTGNTRKATIASIDPNTTA